VCTIGLDALPKTLENKGIAITNTPRMGRIRSFGIVMTVDSQEGAAEVTWITVTANTAKNRKREEATGQQTYETVLAMQSKNNNVRSTLSPTPAANVPTVFPSPPAHPDKTNTDPPTPPPRDRA